MRGGGLEGGGLEGGVVVGVVVGVGEAAVVACVGMAGVACVVVGFVSLPAAARALVARAGVAAWAGAAARAAKAAGAADGVAGVGAAAGPLTTHLHLHLLRWHRPRWHPLARRWAPWDPTLQGTPPPSMGPHPLARRWARWPSLRRQRCSTEPTLERATVRTLRMARCDLLTHPPSASTRVTRAVLATQAMQRVSGRRRRRSAPPCLTASRCGRSC
jgi:hypothetical protein